MSIWIDHTACPRCDGTGVYHHYGPCYRCLGSKIIPTRRGGATEDYLEWLRHTHRALTTDDRRTEGQAYQATLNGNGKPSRAAALTPYARQYEAERAYKRAQSDLNRAVKFNRPDDVPRLLEIARATGAAYIESCRAVIRLDRIA